MIYFVLGFINQGKDECRNCRKSFRGKLVSFEKDFLID